MFSDLGVFMNWWKNALQGVVTETVVDTMGVMIMETVDQQDDHLWEEGVTIHLHLVGKGRGEIGLTLLMGVQKGGDTTVVQGELLAKKYAIM